ncbi:hypothetical protein GUITHDRAFT_105974 [Guillardia theta CCMP2712]|uniref:Uncharacterized protein n=2 Tax=Guillardia theta TaxID=55529 RepID=L1JIQ7_GUITC|nr:hypothetical protein GUITHDRAFT_105974 [Guillardia theta CCMP2712]EKX48366.1 hypothetical protein GUITHDRAFT_105974 [Guillardia theta CCMP2712]|mmetsp:Transcript_42218/g.132997  ORF Transcript_42218/g.132997 Transcript_42218/m.132997 type:complete len:1631 (+) Transcript_42218:38-4930(+)|eukprot:XP_005835346.1 hypothetical protein GUITHDRAFT_105974 [Guillardia theta CCMP2712]
MTGLPDTGNSSCLGICLRDSNDNVIVDAVDHASPNATAIQTGDVILSVNGVDVQGQRLQSIKPLLKGPVGTTVQLVVLRRNFQQISTSLVRHPQLPVASDTSSAPEHKLITWDREHASQKMKAVPFSEIGTADGCLDVTIVDLENLPVAYEVGWSLTGTFGGTLCNPYVECSVGNFKLQTSTICNKLSSGVNQTLRIPVTGIFPLIVCVKNKETTLIGDGQIVGQLSFPMQQIARRGFHQSARFRLLVADEVNERIPTLRDLPKGESVTGLKGRPSTIQIVLSYHGQPYEQLQLAANLKEQYKAAMKEHENLLQKHKNLEKEKKLLEEEEQKLIKQDRDEDEKLRKAIIKKTEKETELRARIIDSQQKRAEREREKWIEEAKRQQEALEAQARKMPEVTQVKPAKEPDPVVPSTWKELPQIVHKEEVKPQVVPEIKEEEKPEPIKVALQKPVSRQVPVVEETLPETPGNEPHASLPPEPVLPVEEGPPAPSKDVLRSAVVRREELNKAMSGSQNPGDKFEIEFLPDAVASLRALAAAGYEIVFISSAVPWVADKILKFLIASDLVGPKNPVQESNVLFCLEAQEKAEIMNRMGGFVAAMDRSWSSCSTMSEEIEGVNCFLFSPDAENERLFSNGYLSWRTKRVEMHAHVQQLGSLQRRINSNPSDETLFKDDILLLLNKIKNMYHLQQGKILVVPHEKSHSASLQTRQVNDETVGRPWLQACESLGVSSSMVRSYEFVPGGEKKQSVKGQTGFYPLAASADQETVNLLKGNSTPQGWEAVKDKKSGVWFYVNHKSKTSTWLVPVHNASDSRAAEWSQKAIRTDLFQGIKVDVGLTLRKSSDGKYRVSLMEEHGPAHRSGLVQIDDAVITIDGREISSASQEEVSNMLVGDLNSGVVLGLERGSKTSLPISNAEDWVALVSEGVPDPVEPKRYFLYRNRKLTVPEEDDSGIFTVRDAVTGVFVYSGPGRYEGVWPLLCKEGKPVAGRTDVFEWRGKIVQQPTFNQAGIATVLDYKTKEVVYRGPGDMFVPHHPGNNPGVSFFVYLQRSPPSKRGRVMIDLARIVLRMFSSDMNKSQDPAGVKLVLNYDYDKMQSRRELLQQQIRYDVAEALNVDHEQISVPFLQKGSVIARFNILRSAHSNGGISPAALADILVRQSKDPRSRLRCMPTTRRIADAKVEGAAIQDSKAMPTRGGELEDGAHLEEPYLEVYLLSARNLPYLESIRFPDAVVEVSMGSQCKYTKVFKDSKAPNFNQVFRFPMGDNQQIKLRVFDFAGLMDGQHLGEIVINLSQLFASEQQVLDGWFDMQDMKSRLYLDGKAESAALYLKIAHVTRSGHQMRSSNSMNSKPVPRMRPISDDHPFFPAPAQVSSQRFFTAETPSAVVQTPVVNVPRPAPSAPATKEPMAKLVVFIFGASGLPPEGRQYQVEARFLNETKKTLSKSGSSVVTFNELLQLDVWSESDSSSTLELRLLEIPDKLVGRTKFAVPFLISCAQKGEKTEASFKLQDETGNEAVGGKRSTALKMKLQYLRPGEKFEVPIEETREEGVIGIDWEPVNKTNKLKIYSLPAGSPAAEAGLKKGDVLAAVNGKDVSQLSIQDIIKLVKGKVGEEVEITVSREGRLVSAKLIRKALS